MRDNSWQSGDVVAFIGDSITAAEKYTRILIDFYVLHFPERHILFHTVATPGLSARTLIAKYPQMVASLSPSAATVMFGINDMQPVLYADSARVTEALLEKRERAFSSFCQTIKELDALLSDVPHLICSPSPHDENPNLPMPLYGGYDKTLARAAAFIKASFSPSLDVHTSLSSANACRLTDTVIGPDRVHPGNIGHAIIAHEILKAQGFLNPRLPLWDDSITEAEKSVLARLGIYADTAPKNPYSDARAIASRRFILHRYVEMNVLEAQGIQPSDFARVDAFLEKQMTMMIEPWRAKAYRDYMKNRTRGAELKKEAEDTMQKMYDAVYKK